MFNHAALDMLNYNEFKTSGLLQMFNRLSTQILFEVPKHRFNILLNTELTNEINQTCKYSRSNSSKHFQ